MKEKWIKCLWYADFFVLVVTNNYQKSINDQNIKSPC